MPSFWCLGTCFEFSSLQIVTRCEKVRASLKTSFRSIPCRSNVSLVPSTETNPPCVSIRASARTAEINPDWREEERGDDFWEDTAYADVCGDPIGRGSLPYHLLWGSWSSFVEHTSKRTTPQQMMIIIDVSAKQEVGPGVMYLWEKTVLVDPNDLALWVSIPMSRARRIEVPLPNDETSLNKESHDDYDVKVHAFDKQLPQTMKNLHATCSTLGAALFCFSVFLTLKQRFNARSTRSMRKTETKDVACSPFVQNTEGWLRQRDGRLRRGGNFYKSAAAQKNSNMILPQFTDEE